MTGNEEAWVVNQLSDSVSVVDLSLRRVVRTISVGDAPTDVVFASGKAFVAVSQEDLIRVVGLPLPASPTPPTLPPSPRFPCSAGSPAPSLWEPVDRRYMRCSRNRETRPPSWTPTSRSETTRI
jgi:YVTN family beta-propeller protein